MCDIVVIEATENMDYGIGLADIGKKLIAESFALRSALDKTGNVYNLYRSRNNGTGMTHFDKLVEAFVGDGYDAHIGFYGTEREVCRLRLSV